MGAVFIPRRVSQQQDVSFGTVANDDFLQRKSGSWTNRTVAQVKTDLGISGTVGTVTSVGASFTGGIVSVSGSPVTTSGTLALTVAGTSGGVPYFSSASTWASSAALASGGVVLGGGAGTAPSTVSGLTASLSTGALTQSQTTDATTAVYSLTAATSSSAALNTQKWSPFIQQSAKGWGTTAGTSQDVSFDFGVKPTQGTVPTGTWALRANIAGGGWNDVITFSSTGSIVSSVGGSQRWVISSGASTGLTILGNSGGSIVSIANWGSSVLAMRFGNTNLLQWDASASSSNNTPDLTLGRQAAANLRQGAADAAAPVAQTSSVQSVVAGTSNTAGVDRTMTCSQGTGTGRGGAWIVQTAPPTASGTSQNALANRQYVYGGETTLTSATDTTVVTVALASSKYVGGYIMATIHADDGTDFQSITHHIPFSAVNKAGTVTAAIASPASSGTAASTGTLTVSWTAVASGANVLLKCNADSSLTETTLKVSWQLFLNGDGTAGITAA